MAFIVKDPALPKGKLWTVKGWLRYGVQELKVSVVLLPVFALLAWGAYSMMASLCSWDKPLAIALPMCLQLCIWIVPFVASVLCRFFWWAGLAFALVSYPVMATTASWVLALLLAAIVCRSIFAIFCWAIREGYLRDSGAQYVHVIGASGWR